MAKEQVIADLFLKESAICAQSADSIILSLAFFLLGKQRKDFVWLLLFLKRTFVSINTKCQQEFAFPGTGRDGSMVKALAALSKDTSTVPGTHL